jgi:hypothetical protein
MSDKFACLEAENTAQRIVEECGFTAFPICPFEIARRHDIQVAPKRPSRASVSSFLIRLSNAFGIRYAPHVQLEAFTRFTVAHELKHYVMADNWKLLPIAVMVALCGGGLIYAVGRWTTTRLHQRVGFTQLDDPASLPLLVLCVIALWLAVTPAFLAFDRHIEREADRFALELSHENDAAARLFAAWAKQGTDWIQPDRFALAFFYTHPSMAERIRMANDYHPWRDGSPLRYADTCSMPPSAATP